MKILDQSRCNLHTNWKDLVQNHAFKEEFSVFVMNEWANAEYADVKGGKMYISLGGYCLK